MLLEIFDGINQKHFSTKPNEAKMVYITKIEDEEFEKALESGQYFFL